MTTDEMRKQFVEKFLSLFGVSKIEFKQFSGTKIYGKAIFDNAESQDFCWNVDNSYAPSLVAFEILEILKTEHLVHGDRIVCTEDVIYSKLQLNNYVSFKRAMNEIWAAEIKMIYDSVETDSFFLHD